MAKPFFLVLCNAFSAIQPAHLTRESELAQEVTLAALLLTNDVVPLNIQRSFVRRVPRASMGTVDDVISTQAYQDALSSGMTHREARTASVFQQVSPSVVGIQALQVALFPFRDYYAGGSGIVWDTQGHIVTSIDVITDGRRTKTIGLPSRVTVSLQGVDKPLDAIVVGTQDALDIAVLKIDTTRLKQSLLPIRIGNSSNLIVGKSCIAIGNPTGLGYRFTTGTVSALNRTVTRLDGPEDPFLFDRSDLLAGLLARLRKDEIKGCIQTDANFNRGCSGGPLLDSNGNLVGVNSAAGIFSDMGFRFAVPIDIVRKTVNGIVEQKS